MDEDQILQSIIADPDVVDPSIDVSKLRQTTKTNPILLAKVPEFSGLEFDPSKGSYIKDLYSIYGGGLPTIDVAQDPTTMIPQTPVIDTPIDAGGGNGGGNGSDSIITPDTTIRDQLIDAGIQAAEDDKGDMMLDEGVPVGEAYAPIDTLSLDQGVPVGEAYAPIDTVDYSELDDLEADLGAQVIKDFEPEQQNLVSQAFSKVGSTASDIMNDLSQIPGAVVDFVNQTVDIAGKKINVGATLLKAGINRIVGGPISLVYDVLQAIAPQDSLANTTTRSIVDELKAEEDYGFNMQSGNLNQDPFGRNPVSALGDYEQTLMDDIAGTGKWANLQTAEMTEAKKQFAIDYFNKKAEKAGGAEVEDGVVLGPGEAPGEDLVTAEDLAAEARKEGLEDLGKTYTNIMQTRDRDDGAADRPSPNEAAGKAAEDAQRAAIQDAARAGMTVNEAKASVGMPANLGDIGGGDDDRGGGKSIVCTAMYQTTGLEDWSKAMKIWYIYQKKYLTIQHQEGYHKLFKPFVKGMHKSNIIKAIGAHVAKHRTQDLKHIMFGSKPSWLGRIYRKILEPICYWVGKYAKR
jgi:hypothetical protein